MSEKSQARRLDEVADLIRQVNAGNLAARLSPSPAGDRVDAVIEGVNQLADQLDLVQRTMEERVAERTAALDRARRDMERLALNDALTGLANRTLLGDRIGQATARADRGQRPLCVLLLDLDEFKTINDGLGHGAGDLILVEVARRILGVVRDVDTVARLGGDEFAVLMPDATEDEALRIAHHALAELQKPYQVRNRTVWTAASIGVCCGLRGQTADLLLRDADTAMYAAKAMGKANVQVFRPEMHHAARERLQLASEMASAIAGDQLRLVYQPIVELESGATVGAEALLRWQHPARGMLSPQEFIPIAEDSGLIVELGHWVVQAAVAQLRSWHRGLPRQFQLHINLSPTEVRWPGLADFVRTVLADADVPAARLALEISETGLMTGDVGALEALLALREMGVGVAIDDFGTGYSSISYLRRLPIDMVKVDRTLVADICADPAQAAFVGAILRLIAAAGLRAVVEGIETSEQLDELRRLGCAVGQGMLLSPPLAQTELARLAFGPGSVVRR